MLKRGVEKIKSVIIIFHIGCLFCVFACVCLCVCVCVRQCVEGLMAEEIREYNVASGDGESSVADKNSSEHHH